MKNTENIPTDMTHLRGEGRVPEVLLGDVVAFHLSEKSSRDIEVQTGVSKSQVSEISKWMTVVFSDESRFTVEGNDGGERILRPVGERYNPKYVHQKNKVWRPTITKPYKNQALSPAISKMSSLKASYN